MEHLQDVAARSQRWWDSFPGRTGLPINQLLVFYMTRAGKVSLQHFAQSTPAVVAGALAEYSPAATDSPAPQEIIDWTIEQPFTAAGVAVSRRDGSGLTEVDEVPVAADEVEYRETDPWGVKSDALVGAVAARVEAGVRVFRVIGASDRDAVLDRLDFAERLRLELGVTVIVRAPALWRADLAAGLVAGRIDLIDLDGGRSPAVPLTDSVPAHRGKK